MYCLRIKSGPLEHYYLLQYYFNITDVHCCVPDGFGGSVVISVVKLD